VLVLLAAAAVARFLPLRRDLFSTEIAGAREVIAYQMVAGEPLALALPPGAELIRILSNLDLQTEVPDAGLPYTLRVRVPEEGRDDRFPLLARPALESARPAGGLLPAQPRAARAYAHPQPGAGEQPARHPGGHPAAGGRGDPGLAAGAGGEPADDPGAGPAGGGGQAGGGGPPAARGAGARGARRLHLAALEPRRRPQQLGSPGRSACLGSGRAPPARSTCWAEPFTPERDRGSQGEPVAPGRRWLTP
jgi:hypothetical protein